MGIFVVSCKGTKPCDCPSWSKTEIQINEKGRVC